MDSQDPTETIYTLRLPKPSDQLIDLVRTTALNRPTALESKKWHDSIQPETVNNVAGEFFQAEGKLAKLIVEEFQPLFKIRIIPTIGILRNTSLLHSGSYAPHTDKVRTLGVNYYIDLGGNNVSTIFYDKHAPDDDTIGGNVLSYSQVNVKTTYTFEVGPWYLLTSRRYHSVENIKTERIILGLSFINVNAATLIKCLVPTVGIEPTTPDSSGRCSTTELNKQILQDAFFFFHKRF